MSGLRYAIVAAMEREVAQLIKGWNVYLGNRQKFFEHNDTIIVCGGIGAAAAQDAAEAIITRRNPEILVSAGFAGALTSQLAAGALAMPAEVIDASTGERFTTASGSGTLVTSNAVLTPATKRDYATRFSAIAVDMEAAAVARVARDRNKQFLAIKAISDEFDFQMPPMERFISSRGEFRTASFALYAALRPSLWPAIRHLAQNSQRASLTLCAALDHLINGKDPAKLVFNPAVAGREAV